jgi:hypothetical protein
LRTLSIPSAITDITVSGVLLVPRRSAELGADRFRRG